MLYEFGEVHTILIIEMNWIGDVLFTTPAIHAIRQRFPQARIDVLIVPWAKAILEENEDISRILVNDEHGEHKGILGRWRLLKMLKKEKYDVAFLMHRSRTRAFLCWLAQIPHRIGYNTKRRKRFLTSDLEPSGTKQHMVEYYLGIVTRIGIPVTSKEYVLTLTSAEKKWASDFLDENGILKDDKIVIINPGGNWLPKRWEAEKFARVADKLNEKYGAKIILTGAPKDIRLVEQIRQKMLAEPLIAAGKTTLKTLAALIARGDLYIGNDSGPTHIAEAVKTPLVALFGPTDLEITGPYGSGKKILVRKDTGCKIPCYDLECRSYRCMDDITVEQVVAAADSLLGVS